MPRSRNAQRLSSYWNTGRIERAAANPPTELPDWPFDPPVDELRHGYTLDDLDRMARVSVQVGYTMATSPHDRYITAWSGIAEELYSSDQPPSERALISAGMGAIRKEVRSVHRTFGHPLDGGADSTAGVAKFWWAHSYPTPGPEDRVVDRAALRQILPRIPAESRTVLLTVAACDGDRNRAAEALGIHPRTVLKRLRHAQRVFLLCWHEGEPPSGIWREVLGRLADDQLVPCGTPSAYHRHRRRGEQTCEPCRRALDNQRKERIARRAS